MKKTKIVFLSAAAVTASLLFTACGGGESGPGPKGKFSFTPYFESGRSGTIYHGEAVPEVLTVIEINPDKEIEREYTFDLEDGLVEDEEHPGEYITYPAEDYISVVQDGNEFTVTTKGVTETEKGEKFEIGIYIYESKSKIGKTEYFTVGQRFPKADTGYNFSSDENKTEEILGKLEEYAMKEYLTGITLFENGGYVRYSPRVHLGTEPSKKYIVGYGFGVLTEGYLDETWWPQISGSIEHKKYLQSGTSSDPGNISGWNAEGSQVADLYGYITSSYWGTKMNSTKNGYVWYPVLAADDCPDPIPLDGEETDKIHKKYRIYVKTDEIAYNYIPESTSTGEAVAGAKYHRRAVQLQDYMTSFQALLTQSCNLFRGAELASDTSHGIKGAYSYFRKTKGVSAEEADIQWAKMLEEDEDGNRKLGIYADVDEHGKAYIDFEFLNPIDVFTAKYTLSSNLYSPLPKDFLKQIGGGTDWVAGAYNFGTGAKTGSAGEGTIINNTLCLGPYYLEEWTGDMETFFKRDDHWFEYVNTQGTDQPRYRIPGVHLRVVKKATEQDDAIFNEFLLEKFDSSSIPVSRFKSDKKPTDLQVSGDSTFKLNVNSLTQPEWDEIFWSDNPKYEKVNKPDQRYIVKDCMSNKHFLNGLFYSINRQQFADDRGVNPSVDYFSNAYMTHPATNPKPYNDSVAHQKAQDAFDPNLSTNLGYNTAKATAEFNRAVTELVNAGKLTLGTPSNPAHISIDIQWMYSTDETTYGQDIANYFKACFNNKNVGSGCVVLDVNHNADSDWQQVYNDHLQVGCFDLGFGAISGNTLAPLNFLEVLKSDNSSGFTLNWGTDTSEVDKDNPIVFEVDEADPEDPEHTVKVKKEWSFDAAWAAADHGCIVKDGKASDSVIYGYTDKGPLYKDDGTAANRLADEEAYNHGGLTMTIPFKFQDGGDGASFEITRVEISLIGYGSLSIDSKYISYQYEEDGKTIKSFTIDFNNDVYETEILPNPDDPEHPIVKEYTLAQWINKLMYDGLKNEKKKEGLDPVKDAEKIAELDNPFAYDKYGIYSYWFLEVWYNITIKGSVPTENSFAVTLTAPTTTNTSAKFAFAK